MVNNIRSSIFKAYDIRGVYPDELDADAAYKIAKAFVEVMNLKGKKVAIGQDIRASSKELAEAAANGLTDSGANAVLIGLCTTPVLNFAVAEPKFGIDAGIMVTASHNPREYNGLKLVGPKAIQLTDGTGINEIKEIVKTDEFKKASPKGKKSNKDILTKYVEAVAKAAKTKDITVVIDAGNGVGGITARPVFEKLETKKVKVIPLFFEPDEKFPNHEPNPMKQETLWKLQKTVRENNADLGIAFDGDADRCVFVDEQGKIVPADFAFGILSECELKKYPDEKVCYDLRFGWAVKEAIKQNKGIPKMLRVGNPFCKDEIINHNALIAGELSAHVMFRDHYGIDDGLYQAIKMMNCITESGKKLSELVQPFQKYFQSGEINTAVRDNEEKQRKMKEVERVFGNDKTMKLDGITVEYDDWWFNLRASNTEPLLRLNVEAKTQAKMERMRDQILKIIRK